MHALALVAMALILTVAAPVDAEVADPYRPPQCAWCPGNRGVEYATAVGAPVTAVRSGYVSYVGRVAGTGYVVVDIGGGLRVTYGQVTPGLWRIGDPVRAGTVIAVTEGPLHIGVRRGIHYVDPAILWERRTVRARLIPG
jgi:murein DD-endopeptidase MepM/ murein hydrolase activator NlpD